MFLSDVYLHEWQINLNFWKATGGIAVLHSYLVSAITPMLQSGSRQLPGRQREGTRPTGQADVGCGAIPLTEKRSGLGVKWPLSSYRSTSLSRVEGVPFWEGKASEEKENSEAESLASLLETAASLLDYQRIFKPLRLRPPILLVPLALATVRQMRLKGNASVFSVSVFLFQRVKALYKSPVFLTSLLLTGKFECPRDLKINKPCATNKRGKEGLLRGKLMEEQL